LKEVPNRQSSIAWGGRALATNKTQNQIPDAAIGHLQVVDDYAQLFERHQGELIRYLYGLVNEAETARDLAQETFVRGYKLWLDDPAREAWRALLYKIATNAALDLLRRQNRFRFSPFDTASSTEPADENMNPAPNVEMRLAIAAVLRELDTSAATCLLLYYDQGFGAAEIARITGASEQAIWQRLSRARRAFCKLYQKEVLHDE
jgi:RNA polymerase sigma-70 factor, ECF subfamily